MKRLISNKLCIAIVGLSVAVITISAVAESYSVNDEEEYVLTVAGEQLHFTAQPQAGYVLKMSDEIGSMDTLKGLLKNAGDVKISPICGLGRKGTYVVYNEQPAEENKKAIKSLKVYNEVRYAAPLFSSYGETVAIIPEIVVHVKPNIEIEQIKAICDRAGCKIIKRMEFTEQEYLIKVLGPDAEAVFVAVEKLGQVPEVEWACPNTASQPKLCDQSVSDGVASDGQLENDESEQDANSIGVFPNDEYFPLQWHLHNTGQSGGTPGADIRAPEAWEITTGDPNITVAVIDNGVDSNHPDLVNNLVPGYDFLDNDDQPDPALDHWFNGHGTCCAGLIAAQGNNGIGLSGVTWNCKLMPIRRGGVRADGGIYSTTLADTATAFRWVATHGADIFSDSWSGYSSPQPIIQSAIADVTKLGGIGRNGKGCVLLAAVGNNSSPIAKYPEVIVVGATDDNDVRCSYSNYGPALAIMAPGAPTLDWEPTQGRGWIWTTDIAGMAGYFPYPPYLDISDYTLFAGTSASCPIAAGVAALILSVEPDLTGYEVRHFLERSAKDLGDPGRDDYYGWGRVDARAALDMVLAKRADLNDDWKVDIEDLLLLIEFWRTSETSADIAPAAKRDGIVDELDLELMMRYWQTEIPEMSTTTQ
jgi:subtilisin family serine protease